MRFLSARPARLPHVGDGGEPSTSSASSSGSRRRRWRWRPDARLRPAAAALGNPSAFYFYAVRGHAVAHRGDWSTATVRAALFVGGALLAGAGGAVLFALRRTMLVRRPGPRADRRGAWLRLGVDAQARGPLVPRHPLLPA
ncbi:MAG: hypothetical protein MZW92_24975 [Comamonadaceae bacterium]|nr:hypothetical protein [Comamonadaceae bacterium]